MCVDRQGDPGPRGVEGPPGFDEAAWWADCSNTFREEQKQLVYASRMGLVANWSGGHPPTFDLAGRSVIDVGGGPVSLLLKSVNRGWSVVLDPAEYPLWVRLRYQTCDIEYWQMPGEELEDQGHDEAWIYNTLQHVQDPEKVISNLRSSAQTIRIFEWIEIDPYPGHPHRLERESLDEWLGGRGFVATLNENGAHGLAYYGVFSGRE